LLLKIIKFTKNSSLNNSNRFFESIFDFKSTTRLELSISTLEIESSRFSNRINSNCQDLNRLIDPNSINRSDAISLLLITISRNLSLISKDFKLFTSFNINWQSIYLILKEINLIKYSRNWKTIFTQYINTSR